MWLELDPDQALFEGKLHGLVIACCQDERPLQGLAGLIDWRLHGALSSCIRSGAVTGKPGECAYLPVQRRDRTLHLILIGAGPRPTEKERGLLPSQSLSVLRKNLTSLRLQGLGASRADLGGATAEWFERNFKDLSLTLVH